MPSLRAIAVSVLCLVVSTASPLPADPVSLLGQTEAAGAATTTLPSAPPPDADDQGRECFRLYQEARRNREKVNPLCDRYNMDQELVELRCPTGRSGRRRLLSANACPVNRRAG